MRPSIKAGDAVGLVLAGRVATTHIISWSRRRSLTERRVVLIGGGPLALELMQVLTDSLVVAGSMLLVVWPVLAACALAVRIEGGPGVIFRQTRVGRDGGGQVGVG